MLYKWMTFMIFLAAGLTASLAFLPFSQPKLDELPLSDETEQCIACHEMFTPGIVADWRKSRHAMTTPEQGMAKDALSRRISATDLPEPMKKVATGCYECHGLNPDKHADSFDHEGFRISIVVSPQDCSTCHPTEVKEYSVSKKAHALDNLRRNPVFESMVQEATGVIEVDQNLKLVHLAASEHAKGQACYACHGTEVTVDGMRTIESANGEMQVPNLKNWPNQGVGRINPDGSMGSCSACHARHEFSIEVARKPYTCAQCHLEPDTPAWDVYRESKHGNLFLSLEEKQEWNAVPWTVGKDFTMPTCATCHSSLIVNDDGDVLAERTHDFGARLWVRIFGLPYAHSQPKDGRTYLIRNADGLPLPVTFDGKPASEFLIDEEEQGARRGVMKQVCLGCHSTQWTENHFASLDTAIAETNTVSLGATKLIQHAWETGIADKTNPFDEPLERLWVENWLFHATSIRYAAAMGGPDYASFENGWWQLTKNLRDLKEMILMREAIAAK